jgi:hypothetical protein
VWYQNEFSEDLFDAATIKKGSKGKTEAMKHMLANIKTLGTLLDRRRVEQVFAELVLVEDRVRRVGLAALLQ